MSALLVPRLSDPSLRSGYARSAAESQFPGLWRGMISAHYPSLVPWWTSGNPLPAIVGDPLVTTTGTWGATKLIQGHAAISPSQAPSNLYHAGRQDFAGPPFSMMWWGYVNANDTGMLSYINNDTPDRGGQLLANADGSVYAWFMKPGPDVRTLSTAGVLEVGKLHCLCMTIKSDSEYPALYHNGRLLDTTDSNSGMSNENYWGFGKTSVAFHDGHPMAFSVWDRALSSQEAMRITADPLAPFRLRPLVVSVPGEAPPATTTTSVVVKRHAPPSIKTGYARSAAESANPGLWRGLSCGLLPMLGSAKETKCLTYEPRLLPNLTEPSDTAYAGISGGLPSYSISEFTGSWVNSVNIKASSSRFTTLVAWNNGNSVTAANVLTELNNTNTYRGIHIRRAATTHSIRLSTQSGSQIVTRNLGSTPQAHRNYVIVYRVNGTSIDLTFLDGLDLHRDTSTASGTPDAIVTRFGYGVETDARLHAYMNWDRLLSTDEVDHIVGDLLAPFRLRPTVISIPAVEETPAATTAITIKRHAEPSIKTGYARNAAESANPGLWRGMVGAWCPMLGVTGNRLPDVSGKGTPAVYQGTTPAWSSSPYGAAFDMDGASTSYFEMRDYAVLNGGNTPISVIAFAASDSVSASRFTVSQSAEVILRIASGECQFILNTFSSNDRVSVSSGIANGEWGLQAGTYDGTTLRAYWNNEVASVVPTGTYANKLEPFCIGYEFGGSNSFDGKVAMVALYDRAITSHEVAILSSDPLAPFRLRPLVVSVPAGAAPPEEEGLLPSQRIMMVM